MNALARREVDRAWLRILHRRHPEIRWSIKPRLDETAEAEGEGESVQRREQSGGA